MELEETDDNIDSIIHQIKNQGKSLKSVEHEHPELKKEDLEKFIIGNAAVIVADSIEMVQSLKLDILSGADSRTVEATAELVKAITGAIESLSKLKLSDDKIKSQKEIKQMEIDSKNIEDTKTPSGLFISREDLIKNIFKKDEPEEDQKVIEI